MNIQSYLETISHRFASGISREHSYRADLENLIRALVSDVDVTNEPVNVTDCGNPDYVISKGKIPIGYIEAKDLGKDLNSKSYKEQFRHYRKALDTITRKLTKNSPGYEATSDTHGRVWINDAQYFDQVPLTAWEFYIGGYQPAQKWLKDRHGRTLSYEDILHWQKIVVALEGTGRCMGEVDGVIIM